MESLFDLQDTGWNTTINLPSYTLAARKCRELASEYEVRGPRKNGNGWFVYYRPKQETEVSVMKEQAVKKLRDEMAADGPMKPYILVIGEFLIRHLESNPQDAEKVLAADKTVAKSIDEMKGEAKKKQQGGMAMLTDAEGFAIVLKYFGIDAGQGMAVQTNPAVTPTTISSGGSRVNVSLDDYI